MADIKVLPKEIAELIAAGEVVERPASVIKELVENSIDAGASSVTVEIANGGITYMRVSDNGSGMPKDQVPTAFLRHATSKIKSADDLDAILTLGFRGEALASIAAVSRVELLTSTGEKEFGTVYTIEGGESGRLEEIGCPKGTTIIIRDLFYNVPARMKFLKKDVTEANTVASVMDRIALSHPEVAFKFIRDGKTVMSTSGDGKLKSSIYSVLGRDFSSSLIPMDYSEGNLRAEGYTCVPSRCRPNRNGQFFFLNGRYIKSGTMAAALDQAYKNSSMVGKFPACVINLTVPAGTVDVNVHPTKTEVRFSEERKIFDVVYRAVKQAILLGDKRPELKIPDRKPLNIFKNEEKYTQLQQTLYAEPPKAAPEVKTDKKTDYNERAVPVYTAGFGATEVLATPLRSGDVSAFDKLGQKTDEIYAPVYEAVKPQEEQSSYHDSILDIEVSPQEVKDNTATVKEVEQPKKANEDINSTGLNLNNLSYVGQAFGTYILVSLENTLYFIDKHAAHERINFERLKKELKVESQVLLAPVSVTLMREEYSAVITNFKLLEQCGFITEDFGDGCVIVRAVPAMLDNMDIPSLMREIAGNLLTKGTAVSDRIDDILHSIACKSAIKAGHLTSKEEQLQLAIKVLSDKNLMYCPHGRPIAFEMKKSQIEKQFGRIV